jgi:hypothetical protein
MKSLSVLCRTAAPALVLACASGAFGQCANAVPGPDVIVGDIPDVSNYGLANGKRAYAIGTTSCNLGQIPLRWDDTTNMYPVISQNIYRLRNGRFEQLGQAWLKHGFCALQGNVCCACAPGGTCDDLYPGCSDPYGSGLNGSQGGLGPKHEIDAAAGYIPLNWNPNGVVEGGDTNQVIFKRLQAPQADLANAGALYFVSSTYIQPQDAEYGNDNNNQSYRRVTINATSFNMSLNDTTRRGINAIQAWRDHGLGLNQPDPSVVITTVDDPSIPPHDNATIPGTADGGRFLLGAKVTNLGNGQYRYEYALQNHNNHRSGAAFTIPLPAGAVVTNATFKDVPYHSGEPYNGTDWSINVGPSSVSFRCTETFAQNPNANALRWDTIYNFAFDCNVAPVNGSAVIDLFRPPSSTGPAALNVAAQIPDPNGGGIFTPPNDNCANASTVFDGTTLFSTVNATTDGPDEPTNCNFSAYTNIGNDIWFRWTATASGTATVSTCGSSFDTKLGVYTGCPTGSNQVIACNDDSAACGANSLQSSLTFTAVSGTTYFLRVGGYASGANPPATGSGSLSVVGPVVQPPPPPPAPTNDVCATGATLVTVGTYNGTTAGTTNDGTATCGNSAASPDVWFRYQASAAGTLTVDTCGSDFDTVLSIRSSTCSGTQLGCNDDYAACGLDSRVQITVAANSVYFIRVAGYNNATGNYTLNVAGPAGIVPPSNDGCANRIGIGLGATAFSTVGATTDGPTHAACNFFGNNNVTNDVWFNYPCFANGNLTIDTCGASYDSKIAVYANSGCTDFEARILGCSDDVCGNNATVTIPVTAGQNYTIRVGGFAGAVGSGNLNLTLVTPPACSWQADGCFADYNNDGSIDGDDVIAFFADWDNGNPCADSAGDGVDGDDVIAFFGSWDANGVGFPGC